MHTRRISISIVCFVCLGSLHVIAQRWDTHIMQDYRSLASDIIYDRTGAIARMGLNAQEQVCMFAVEYPTTVTELVLAKEDRWFYYHPGINPYRTLVATLGYMTGTPSGGASTITQQLAKTLLHTTTKRSLKNKLEEFALALVLEYRHTKGDILTMYLNTVPLGGNIQGFPAGARAYFEKRMMDVNENEALQLITALSKPTSARPLSETNLGRATILAHALDIASPLAVTGKNTTPKAGVWLELADLQKDCSRCRTTLDVDITERIRTILHTHVDRSRTSNLTHGAIAVINVHTGELLVLVGSPDPNGTDAGARINMALATRPIGSTIKPFLYLQGFMKGLRPYTQVEDREHKFAIETGFPLYPKNYDGQYRGTVTLEEALANSLNVPTVEVLRYNTLPDAYTFLGQTLGFKPPQAWDTYAYGIALGGLELDLVTLTQAFSALADHGKLKRLVTAHTTGGEPHYFTPPHATLTEDHTITSDPRYVELVNAILTDRTAGVEEFGQKGSLNLSREGYAVKTGTSRDYHDSWTVGYTGDYAVGVWVGNVENKPMRQITGAIGAGAIWHDVMELMYTTPYNLSTKLDMSHIIHVPDARGYSYGLADDDVETARGLLTEKTLLVFPHEGDTFLYTDGMRIPLTASAVVTWEINSMPYIPKNGAWYPTHAGTYTLTATAGKQREQIHVVVSSEPISLPYYPH